MSFSWPEPRRDIFLAQELRICRGHLHCEILDEVLEVIGAGDEIGFAVHLDEYAELGARMNIRSDDALTRDARGLLRGGSDAMLAQDDLGFSEIPVCLHQCALAFHHARAGAVAELFY
jgi:hypothetical protein